MKRSSLFWLTPLLVTLCSTVQAACVDDVERVRGQYLVSLAPSSGVLLRIEHSEEELGVYVSGQQSNLRIAHPAGAGIDHYILLESGEVARNFELCLVARYAHSQPGSYDILEIPISNFSTGEVALLREMTQAAVFWGENNPTSRLEALQIFQRVAANNLFTDSSIVQYAALFEALALMGRSEHSVALERLDALLLSQINDPTTLYKTAWTQGEALLRLRQSNKAIESMERAIGVIEQELQGIAGEHSRDLVDIRLLLAQAYLDQGRSEEAEELIKIAASTAEKEFRLLGRVYDALGYLEIIKSQQTDISLSQNRDILGHAIDVMLTGRFFSEASLDRVTQVAFENNLGFVYDRLGEYPRAFTHYRQVLQMVTEDEDPMVYRVTFANLGRLYQYTGDYPRSESYYRRSIELSEQSSGVTSTGRCPLGTTLRLNGNVLAAESEHSLCLQQAELVNNPAATALALYELSEDYLVLGDDEAAWRYISLAWEKGAAGIPVGTRARIQRSYAWYLQKRGNTAAANAVMSEVIAQHELARFRPVEIIDNHAMGMRIAILQDDREKAEQQGLIAVDLIEQQYENFEAERLGPSWSSRTHEIYVTLAEVYLNAYQESGDEHFLDKAFNITERSRAISLRQQFASQLANIVPVHGTSLGVSSNIGAERAQIALISEIANAYAVTNSINEAEISLPSNYYLHQDVLSLYRLTGLRDIPVPDAMTREQIQARLKSEQAILYYLMTENSSYVFTLTSEQLSVTKQDDREGTERLIERARLALADANSSPYSTLMQLSDRLLGDLPKLTNVDQLYIVPHGSLHALPFSALPLPGNTLYEPLVSRFTLQLLPSLTTWLMDKELNEDAGNTDIAIFADPVFDNGQQTQQFASLDSSDQMALRSWSSNLERLAYTAIEAEKISALFPEDRTVLLTGESASRANLAREDIRHAKVLHIATHGYFNAASDDNVGLGFSVVDENGTPDSGFVTLPELFSHDFFNELVLISGCDTAMGRPLAGEGMMGISRGFVAQGVKHVISTLWPVSDRASADFIAIFYRQLLDLGNVSEALRATRIEIQQNPSYRNPFYWAAYVLTSVSQDQNMAFPRTQLSQSTL